MISPATAAVSIGIAIIRPAVIRSAVIRSTVIVVISSRTFGDSMVVVVVVITSALTMMLIIRVRTGAISIAPAIITISSVTSIPRLITIVVWTSSSSSSPCVTASRIIAIACSSSPSVTASGIIAIPCSSSPRVTASRIIAIVVSFVVVWSMILAGSSMVKRSTVGPIVFTGGTSRRVFPSARWTHAIPHWRAAPSCPPGAVAIRRTFVCSIWGRRRMRASWILFRRFLSALS
mmetsp:Transcript_7477/g.20737  ORF Transcript_7477/g.20737 Transcript_7477/m.20737 type:complete len:233 (-) Transcript_7477:1137-1835(-)